MNTQPAPVVTTTRLEADKLSARFPALLVHAERLAASVVSGVHGRRRAGPGEDFWQFRPAIDGDNWRNIDWRRSGRGDAPFIRQQEWQSAQSVYLWIDRAASMDYAGDKNRESKSYLAHLLGLATAILLGRGGERVGLIEDPDPPRIGQQQVDRITAQLAARGPLQDYGIPASRNFAKGSRALFLSDFLGDWEVISSRIRQAADQGVAGALVMILDPTEESFPFDGRTEFRSMSGTVRFETLRAKGLREAYLGRLTERKSALEELCRNVGWHQRLVHTDDSALDVLTWIFHALERRR